MGGNSFDHYSRKAKGAINRFYEHADTRTLSALQELVSDLALSEGASKEKLWTKAQTLLAKAQAPAPEVARVLAAQDIKAFAALVGKLMKPK